MRAFISRPESFQEQREYAAAVAGSTACLLHKGGSGRGAWQVMMVGGRKGKSAFKEGKQIRDELQRSSACESRTSCHVDTTQYLFLLYRTNI